MDSLKKEINQNYELSKKLSKEYSDIYNEIVLYLRASKLNDTDAQEAISDILTMLIDGQERNITVQEVLGHDLKEFCDNTINSYEPNKRFNILVILQYILMFIGISTGINYIFIVRPKIINDIKHLFIFNYSLSMLINTLTISIMAGIIIKYFFNGYLELNKKKRKKRTMINYVWISVLFVANITTLAVSQFYLGDIILFTTKTYFVVIFIVALYLISRFLQAKNR